MSVTGSRELEVVGLVIVVVVVGLYVSRRMAVKRSRKVTPQMSYETIEWRERQKAKPLNSVQSLHDLHFSESDFAYRWYLV